MSTPKASGSNGSDLGSTWLRTPSRRITPGPGGLAGMGSGGADLRHGDDLAGVPRGVLRGMKQQTENRRRKALPSDVPAFAERVVRRRADLCERLLDGVVHHRREHNGVRGWMPRIALVLQIRELA